MLLFDFPHIIIESIYDYSLLLFVFVQYCYDQASCIVVFVSFVYNMAYRL